MLIVCARQEGQRAHTIRMDQYVHGTRNTADAEEHQARHQGDSAPARKSKKILLFAHLIVPLDKVLTLENKKENLFSFCILLT